MKIVTLMENTSCLETLTCEHGLSLYLETRGYKILFDAGQSSAFAENAKKLGINLDQVDFVVLSHGHYDHGGGLGKFLECNQTAPVYVSSHAFEPHYSQNGYIGLDLSLESNQRIPQATPARIPTIIPKTKLKIPPLRHLVDFIALPSLIT